MNKSIFFISRLSILVILMSHGKFLLSQEKDILKSKSMDHFIQQSNIAFIENNGQFVDAQDNFIPQVLFKSTAKNVDIYVTTKGLTYVFHRPIDKEDSCKTIKNINYEWSRLDMCLSGEKFKGIKKENITKEWPAPWYYNYYLGHCPNGIMNVQAYSKITIKEIYPNIDWVMYSDDSGLKYDFVIKPGGKLQDIKLNYEGAKEIAKHNDGKNVKIQSLLGELTEGEIISYQKQSKQKIKSAYIINDNTITFSIDNYDMTDTLIIDPPLVWATFYGGTSANWMEMGMSTATDGAGNVYVSGYTDALNFPTLNPNTGNYFQGTMAGSYDLFLLKFNNCGELLWATYYGGSSYEWGSSVTTDMSGNIFLLGASASGNLPTLNPGGGAYYQSTNLQAGFYYDLFIVKFNNAGVMLCGTYYGGSDNDGTGFSWSGSNLFFNDIVTDASGNVFVVGTTHSFDFPLMNPGGGAYFQPVGVYDAYILKFDNNGVRQWATYLGGNGYNEYVFSASVDGLGNLSITGLTDATNFPVFNPGNGAYFQGALNGLNDGFISKFDNNGVMLWSTYFGGSGSDVEPHAIVNDATGNLFLTGFANSTTMPLANPGNGAYFQSTFVGPQPDLFISKFNTADSLVWSTLYGGPFSGGGEESWDMDTDPAGNIYITGSTASSDFPLQNDGGYFQATMLGGRDAFLLKFDTAGVRQWATYFGGASNIFGESGQGIASDASGNIFVTGITYCTDFPLQNPGNNAYYQATIAGSADAFLLKFGTMPNCSVLNATIISTNPTCNGDSNGTATVNPTGGTSPYTYLWSPGAQTTQTATGLSSGTYTVTVTDASSTTTTATVTITQPTALTSTVSYTNASCNGSNNGSATVTAAGGTPAYTYLWMPSGGTTSAATGLSAGNYTVTNTDANGCTVTQTFTITQPPMLTVTASANPTTCGNNNGTATVISSGGTPVYTYLWNNSQTTSTATGLGAGNYTVTITDANGCTVPAIMQVASSNAPIATATFTPTNCNTNIGTATVNPSGGSAPYTYSWSTSPWQTTQTATGIAAGNYTVTITDINGCNATATVQVTSFNTLTGTFTSTSTNCNANTGTATVIPSGGTAPYAYSWSTSPAQTTQTAVGLAAGNYTITITDANGCSATGIVVVTSLNGPTAFAGTTTTISQGSSTSLSASGGVTYSWVPSAGLNCTTCANPIATPSQNTDYCVFISDTNNCMDSACVTVFVDLLCGDFFIPNAFSPNGDNENDVFRARIGNIDCIKDFILIVYNRWGEKVYESDNPSKGWDGNYNGKKSSTSVCVFYCRATLISGSVIDKKGNISLIR